MAISRMPKGNTIPIDPDVAVPEAVRRAAAAADAAQKAAYPELQSTTPDIHAPPQIQTPREKELVQIVEGDPPQRLPDGVTGTTVTPFTPPAQQQRDEKKEAPPQQRTEKQLPADDNDESWKSKYEAQLGRNAPLHKQNKELADRIGALEQLLEGSRQQQAPPQAASQAKLITSQEEEDFGPEMIDVIRRAAKEVASPLQAEIEQLRNQVGNTTATITRSTRQSMLNTLGEQIPEWKEINVAPEFHSWLALPDPFSGVTRKSLLQAAYDKNETSRVLAFFNGFVSELAATAPAEASQTPVPTERNSPSKPTLQQLAAPGRARTAASVTPPADKPIIRTSDINALYAAKRKGLYDGREQEFAQYERELEEAMREGRVVRDT
jgi:hypothetical protein